MPSAKLKKILRNTNAQKRVVAPWLIESPVFVNLLYSSELVTYMGTLDSRRK